MSVKEQQMVSTTVDGENQFTNSIKPSWVTSGYIDIVIEPDDSWSGTITVQRSFDNGDSWHDTDSFTSGIGSYLIEKSSKALLRIGCKTGNYSSGTCKVMLTY